MVPPSPDLSLFPDDPRSWDRLIDAVGPASILVVIGAAMGTQLSRRHTAEDIWQDTLLHAWRDRHQLEWQGITAFRRWLIAIARNRISDLADRDGAAKRRAEISAVPFEPQASSEDRGHFAGPQTTTTPSRVASTREQAAAMQTALNELGEAERDVVRLRLFEGMTVPQVAAALELGESAVRHRFRKGAAAYERLLAKAIMTQSRSHVSTAAEESEQASAIPDGSRPEILSAGA